MKKLLATLCVLTCIFGAAGAVACGGEEPSANTGASSSMGGGNSSAQPVEITGVEFMSVEYVYNGTERELVATGIPEGVQATYTNNKGTNVGSYSASVLLSGEGYISKTLTATLTITPKDITGVTLEQDGEIKEDGQKHFPVLSGSLPTGATKTWKFNGTVRNDGVSAVGEYAVELLISAPNHNPLTLTATFTVKRDYAGMANAVMQAFKAQPDPWGYLPESLSIENKAMTAENIPAEKAYEGFVNVENIPTDYIGQQLDVVYDVLTTCDVALGYVGKVHGVLNTIEQAYQLFINNSPDDWANFSGSVQIGGLQCGYAIALDGDYYTLTVTIASVEVHLFGDVEKESYGARIQLSANNVLKYEMANDKLMIALNILNSYTTYVEFLKEGEDTLGYIYKFMGVAGVSKSTSALLKVDGGYTTVVGTMGDFIPTASGRNCEVYDNTTGKLVGTEVSEELLEGKSAFDTCWYNLSDVEGITSIKKADGYNGLNPDTIFINGNSTLNGEPNTIHTKFVIAFNWTAGSRKFDIEFKEVRTYVYNAEKEKYESVTFEIPMVFIQENYIDDFNGDFKDVNKTDAGTKITVNLSVAAADKQAVHNGYHTLVEAYNQIASLITQELVVAFCAK